MWITALSQIVRYPLFGRGVTSYMGYFLETFNITYAMHNTYLAMLLDVGLVGFCLFMFPAAKSFVSAAKNKNTMICAALASCLLSAFFIDALLSRYIWNVMIIGILYYNTHCQQKEEA